MAARNPPSTPKGSANKLKLVFGKSKEFGELVHISAVEIDLSKTPLGVSFKIVEEYILHVAPRDWIYNQRGEKALLNHIEAVETQRQKITAAVQLQRDKAERDPINRRRWREEQQRSTLQKAIQFIEKGSQLASESELSPDQKKYFSEMHKSVLRQRLGRVVGLSSKGEYCFSVPAKCWQSAILEEIVIRRYAKDPGHFRFYRRAVFDFVKKNKWIRPEFDGFFTDDMELKLRVKDPEFRTPYNTVSRYLDFLLSKEVIYRAYDWLSTSSRYRGQRRKKA